MSGVVHNLRFRAEVWTTSTKFRGGTSVENLQWHRLSVCSPHTLLVRNIIANCNCCSLAPVVSSLRILLSSTSAPDFGIETELGSSEKTGQNHGERRKVTTLDPRVTGSSFHTRTTKRVVGGVFRKLLYLRTDLEGRARVSNTIILLTSLSQKDSNSAIRSFRLRRNFLP